MTIAAGTKLGRYEIRSQLGAGGMGEVYLAQDTTLDRRVALKILPAEVADHPDRMKRFEQEAKTASALNHPNIITIYEIEQIDSVNFIATEFIDGVTLRQRMKNAPMKLGEVLDVAIQTASALSAAHAAGIVHRDIKPENIMQRADGIVKVLDFGLAKLTERLPPDSVDTEAPTSFKTDAGTVVGTIVYMSPEQARGLQVDARTDIFSLGIVLYEMVAGCLPFAGSNTNEIIAAILNDKEAPPLARYAQEAPVELERIVAKAVRKNRDERYQTVKDLLLDLKALKQELEFAAKLERSAPPATQVSAATVRNGQTSATIEQAVASTVETSRAPATSSSLVAGIKRHKLAAIIALVVSVVIVGAGLVLGAMALIAYRRARNSEVAIESIAVLPFTNQNHDPDSEYLSDGLTESIINSLTQLPNLKVIARSSVFRYKGKETDPMAAGKELGVRSVLTGRILQRADNLVISTELLDVRDNKQLWGEQYERKVSGLLAVQREIAKEISSNLRLKLSGAEQSRVTKRYTENSEAYQLYLQGRYYQNKRTEEGLKKSIQYFQEAIAKDSNYALAYTGLADSYSYLGNHGFLAPNDASPKGKAAALKALEIDDTLAEAHTSLGYIRVDYDWDWASAEKEFKRAIELNPSYTRAHSLYAASLGAQGRFGEAHTEMKQALEPDPLSLYDNTNLGWYLYMERRYDDAIAQYRKTLDMDPNFAQAHLWFGQVYEQKKMYSEAIAEFQKAIALYRGSATATAALGHAYAIAGNKSEAQRVLNELKELSKQKYVSSYDIAVIYAGRGDKDQVFVWLEKAYVARDGWLAFWVKVDPRFDEVRPDPRFADLLRRVGHTP